MGTARRSVLCLGLAITAVTGCRSPSEFEHLQARPGEEVYTLYVAPRTVTCTGMYEMQCMLVRRDPTSEWQYFYDGIEGFHHEAGYEYALTVGERVVPNPPADGSSRGYRLLGIVYQRRASP